MIGSIKRPALRFLNKVIRRNRLITYLLFGIRIPDSNRVGWDFTTIALKHCLLRYITDGTRVLEIGTGSYAMLSLYIARHRKCDITATDLQEKYIESSRKTAELNRQEINFIVSDMYDGIDGIFDVIFWNSVYIPRQVGMDLGLRDVPGAESDWCGGETGIENIDRFLRESAEHIAPGGRILLGFNPVYLRKEPVEDACRRNGYVVQAVHGAWLCPSKVYVLGRRRAGE